MSSKTKHILILVGVAIVAAAYASKIPVIGFLSQKLPGNDWADSNGNVPASDQVGIMGDLISGSAS